MIQKDKSKSCFSKLEPILVFLVPFLLHIICGGGFKPLYAFDMATVFIVYLGQLRKAFWGGWFPFWDALWAGGYPFAADPQTLSYYPPAWIAAIIFPSRWAAMFLVFFHLGLGALGIWLLVRRLFDSRDSAWLSAIIYSLGGYATGHLLHLTMIQVLGFLPITLFLLISEEQKSFFGWKTLIATFCFALIFLAGHPQSALMATSIIIILIISFQDKRLMLRCIISLILGTSLSLIGVLSFKELAIQSVRFSFSYKDFTEGSLHPIHLLYFVSPSFFGSLRGVCSSVGYWGGFFIQERIAYTGFIPLVLALTACAIGLEKFTPWRRQVRIFFILIIIGAALSCSEYLGIAKILYRIPLVNRFRVHGRYIFFTYTGIAFLAPMGFLALCGKWPGIEEARARKACLAAILIVICIFYFFCLWGLVSPESFPGIEKNEASLIGLIKLWGISNLTIPIPSLLCILLIIIIRKRRTPFQIAVPLLLITLLDIGLMRCDLFLHNVTPPQELCPVLKKNAYGEGWTLVEFPYLLPNEMNILYPNHPLENGRMVLNQYNPLILRSLSHYLGMNEEGRITQRYKIVTNRRICSAFGIQRVILCKAYRRESNDRSFLAKRIKPGMIEMPQPDKIGDFVKILEYRNLWFGEAETEAPYSLAYIPQKTIKESDELILSLRGNEKRRSTEDTSIIHEDQNPTEKIRRSELGRIMENGKGKIMREWQWENSCGAEIDAEKGTYIIFRILDYPGWRLYIDGKEADFFKTNGCFIGARALEGRHKYEWRFRPTYFKAGIFLCIASFVIMALFLFLNRHMRGNS